jgi:opacity protein-like surface antigen
MFKRMLLITALLSVIVALPAAALDFDQKQWYGQGIVALPMGNFGDIANFGFGAGVGMLVPHTPELSFRGEISYIYFTTEDVEGFDGAEDIDVSASMIPITALAQYNMKDSEMYLLGGLGIAIAKASVDYPESVDTFGFDASYSDTSTEFGLTLGAGYHVKPGMTLEGRFNVISDANSLSVNLGYFF